MKRTYGSYSGYEYAFGPVEGEKWILKQTYRYDNRDPKIYIFNSEDEVYDKISEIEAMFDHRSPWD